MAWFDRNPGAKKGPQEEPEKSPDAPNPASEPTPAAAVTAPVPPPAPKVESPPPSAAGLVGYLYKGSRITGQLSFQGAARVDGAVDGEIHCQGTLTIGESAEIRAKISGHVVIIRGTVDGNVTAKEKVELAAPARLIGNIESPRLIVTEGVVFDGDCSMGVRKQKGGGVSPHNLSADKAAAAKAPKLQADSNS
jgi:cytoskeletal protein CcmA (bactofilin family)